MENLASLTRIHVLVLTLDFFSSSCSVQFSLPLSYTIVSLYITRSTTLLSRSDPLPDSLPSLSLTLSNFRKKFSLQQLFSLKVLTFKTTLKLLSHSQLSLYLYLSLYLCFKCLSSRKNLRGKFHCSLSLFRSYLLPSLELSSISRSRNFSSLLRKLSKEPAMKQIE